MNFILNKSKLRIRARNINKKYYNRFSIFNNNILSKNKLQSNITKINYINNIDSVGETSYFVLKNSLLFVFFYCSLQWFYYKNLREENDDNE